MRLTPSQSVVVVIDMQQRILSAQPHADTIVWNSRRLLDGAKLFDVPVVATEQYPEKLGPTVAALADRISPPIAKRQFTAIDACPAAQWKESGRHQIILAGIETHICILQTMLDLLSESFHVSLAVDAITARHSLDHEIALRAAESHGAILTTVESVLFQWCGHSEDDRFKAVSELAREEPPSMRS